MKVFLAGKYESQYRLKTVRTVLKGLGHTVVSTWLDEKSPDRTSLAWRDTQQAASRDWADLRQCDLFILDTNDQDEHGGREVELGLALGTDARTWIVGPSRNIYHSLAGQRFYNWFDALAWLVESKRWC